jgi:hypothetical protein
VKLCHCGKPLHYTDRALEDHVEEMVSRLGEFLEVEVSGRKFLVPRHYIALHGLKGVDVASLGFEEVGGVS